MGDYARWAIPPIAGVERSAAGAPFLGAQPRQALDPGGPQVRGGPRGAAAPGARRRRAARVLPARRDGPARRRLRAAARGQPAARLLRDHRLRPGRPAARPLRATTSTTSASSGCSASSGDADGPPVQAAGQIADIGGGSLMAAFGILAALRERDRSGEGQLVDVSMADGALSWLAMAATRTLAEGALAAARRARARRAAALLPPLPLRGRLGDAAGRSSRSSGRRGVAASAART